MPTYTGILVPTDGKTYSINLNSVTKDNLTVVASQPGDDIVISINITIPKAEFVSEKPSSIPDDKFYLEFSKGMQLKTYFNPSGDVHRPQIKGGAGGDFYAFELDFDVAGKVGGAGEAEPLNKKAAQQIG